MLRCVQPFGCPVAEVSGSWVAYKGDGLATRGYRPYPPFTFALESEGGPGLAVHAQTGKELFTPDTCGDVYPPLVPPASGHQPTVSDRRDSLSNWGRLQDG